VSTSGSIGDGHPSHPVASDRASRVERQLAVAQQITHIGSWEWDMRTNAVAWSDELYRIYGLEPRSCELTLEVFLSKLHPEDRPRVQAHVRQAIERAERFAYPERIFRPDGTMRELETVGEVARDESGRVVGLIGTCRDVTDERKRDEIIRLYADIVRNVQIGLSVWKIDAPDDIRSIRLVAFNPAAEQLARMPLAPYLGHSLVDIAPYAQGGELQKLLTRVASDGLVHEATVHRSRDPKFPNRAMAMKAFPLPGQCVGLALEDITQQTTTQRLQAEEQRCLEMIATGLPLGEILTALVLMIEEHAPPTIASILLLDPAGRHVRHGAAPNLPEAYIKAIDGAEIGPNAGSCGTAAYTRTAVVSRDIATDPRWEPYRELALRHGLRACWSTPIFGTDERVLGTFALYFKEPRSPNDADLTLIGRATHVAGIAIERRQLEEQLRDLSAHVESVREDERTGIAREIHDELGQALTAIKMDLAWLRRRASGDAPLSREGWLEKIETMSQMADDVINQVRRISAELRPGVLDDLGLLAALEWQAQEFEKRTGTECHLRSNLGDTQLERNLSTAVFRIFQEALTNNTRYAEASRVDVSLELKDGWLSLEVKDDGKGIAPEAIRSPTSLGLLGISERARRLGGSAVVSAAPAPARGTIVSLRVPCDVGSRGGAS
jgi:PAS domain S-box-containing protein